MLVDTAIRLNLGCGDERLDGFVNVDLRSDCHADVVADVTSLADYPDGSVEMIRAFDLLEHFPASRTCRILRCWWRLLRDDGELILKVPNLEALAAAFLATDEPRLRRVLIRNIYGGHRWGPDGAWDAHHTGWWPTEIEDVLADCGFTPVSNDRQLNMTVEAFKHA